MPRLKEKLKSRAREFGGTRGWSTSVDLARALKSSGAFIKDSARTGVSAVRSGAPTDAVKRGFVRYNVVEPSRDSDVYKLNARIVADALSGANIAWWWVDGASDPARRILAVDENDRPRALSAISKHAASASTAAGLRVGAARHQGEGLAAESAGTVKALRAEPWIRVAVPVHFRGTDRYLGLSFGCDLEFWHSEPDGSRIGPRPNRAAARLEGEWAALIEAERDGDMVLVPAAFEGTMLEDILFPIDVVYTWVDGEDPVWRAKKSVAAGGNGEGDVHAEATHDARFRSREELRYSLRSVDDFAPWINHIFVVTDQQVPDWLDTEHDKITVVDHREIFPDDGRLPVFNSNAIISRIHHIPGLSEHFIYMNDDVFLGRPVAPQDFFLASGIARVSPSKNRRPFGAASVEIEPHMNLTRNIRELLEAETGRTVSRAIKHTPHPMLRSVLVELEQRFPTHYDLTTSHKFRHHDDIVADQLHHYYAQIVGKAVPSEMDYAYINVLDAGYEPRLRDIGFRRDIGSFCLNDAPVPAAKPIEAELVADIMKQYFPAESSWER